ncbi:DMT family transporter [Rubrivivax sp. A210]|uniref:DMT family transporter n=1 Tax=Rubrivivax sp. A210 TaxID=2772301 RepID=UPI0019BCE4E2|nr:DMT family transporter [Rubrivivax sp. A210]CAD5374816.1 DMT family transporter [Rubrivivax sp. A210]
MRLTPRLALLMTLAPLLWAGNAVVGRLLAGGAQAGQPGAALVPPLTLNLLRWLLTALILLPLAWRALLPLSRLMQRWPYLLALGLLGVGAFNSLQYLALRSSSPLNVTLVSASMPVWMLAVGSLFYGEHPRPAQLLGAVCGLLGVAVVLSRGAPHNLLAVHFVAGDLYVLAAIIGWAFYSWLLARPPAHMRGAQRPDWDWAGLLLVQTLFGLLGAGLFTAGEQALGAAPIQWSAGLVAALVYVSLGASVIAYRCWGLGVAEGGPALAAFFNNLTPLFAALLSALLLGEMPQGYHAAAFGLIVGGIVVSMRR